MGFFFRRGVGFGPFRLNFSKSGIGASVGVKGARLTMKPNGGTYVTVGRYGFYYRETLSPGGRPTQNRPPEHTNGGDASASDGIATADVTELVESSSEALLAKLNRRATMSNPAWFFYAFSVIAFCAAFLIPRNPGMTPLPDPSTTLAPCLFILGVVVHRRNTAKCLSRLFSNWTMQKVRNSPKCSKWSDTCQAVVVSGESKVKRPRPTGSEMRVRPI